MKSNQPSLDSSKIFERYYNLSLRFLSYRPRSEKEVVDYLNKKLKNKKLATAASNAASHSLSETSADAKALADRQNKKLIAEIMQRLVEHKFVDDLAFAKFWIEHRKKGLRILRLELVQKGVSKELIEKATSEFDIAAKENGLLQKLIEKKSRSLKNLPSQKAREKLIAFLLRKGFDYEDIKKTLREN